MTYHGGYIIERLDMIRGDFNKHTAALPNPISQPTLDALNAIQATPWRINRWVLDVMAEAHDKGLRSVLPALTTRRPASGRTPDDVWAAMSEEARMVHSRARREAWAASVSNVGQVQALLDQLTVAQQLRDKPAIWFPHVLDFRHRIYPAVSSGPQPQGDDRSKALLMFASGLPLGEDGLFWLCVRAANCAGQDKLPLKERVDWALNWAGRMAATADAPFRDLWWTEMDEPWQFLATCHELSQMSGSARPEAFISHLPIPQDGSCNGLQHLSAMGLDPEGSAATNLASGPRRDIYQEVADTVAAVVAADAAQGLPEAGPWVGQVTRKVVKRAVMTTPYGVSSRGIRVQLVDDKMVPGPWDTQHALAAYLGGHIEAAIGATVARGKAIMGWLQDTAQVLAKAGHPFDWTTPTGSLCRQSYHRMTESRVTTLMGSLQLIKPVVGGLINDRKQASGASPNYVHSFDAAHLALTVNACVVEGMRSFHMIHDSFGAHACHSTALAAILRRQFISIYETDWLARTWAEVAAYAAGVAIPPLPDRGTFDIQQVAHSEFFFS